jgi:ribosomal protein L20
MKKEKIILNRKVISEIILKDITTFKKIINYLEKPFN